MHRLEVCASFPSTLPPIHPPTDPPTSPTHRPTNPPAPPPPPPVASERCTRRPRPGPPAAAQSRACRCWRWPRACWFTRGAFRPRAPLLRRTVTVRVTVTVTVPPGRPRLRPGVCRRALKPLGGAGKVDGVHRSPRVAAIQIQSEPAGVPQRARYVGRVETQLELLSREGGGRWGKELSIGTKCAPFQNTHGTFVSFLMQIPAANSR